MVASDANNSGVCSKLLTEDEALIGKAARGTDRFYASHEWSKDWEAISLLHC